MEEERIPNDTNELGCYGGGNNQFTSDYRAKIAHIAQEVHKISNDYENKVESLIELMGTNLSLEECVEHAAYAEFLLDLELLYTEQYTQKRLDTLKRERSISADDEFPISAITQLSAKDFKSAYTEEEQGVKRHILLSNERRKGQKAIYDYMR